MYAPNASQALVVGRYTGMGTDVTDSLESLTITAVDPRRQLAERVGGYLEESTSVIRLHRDPLNMLRRRQIGHRFDVVIVQPGHLDSYRTGRLLSVDNLVLFRSVMADSSVIMVELPFDTDRYVTDGDARVLRIVTASMQAAFPQVAVWPGETTLVFASAVARMAIPLDSLIDRLNRLPFDPLYVTDVNLTDRLGEWKVQRLREALAAPASPNTLELPVLPYVQAWHRAHRSHVDRFLVTNLLDRPAWLLLLPLAALAFFGRLLRDSDRRRQFGLFLYVVAGAVSLSLELTSFYVYQSMAGSLYAELAVLVGAFMLGLALGTYITYRSRSGVSAQFGLGLLVVSTVVFALTYDMIVPQALLVYHTLFLLAAAMGTGAVFVGATRRYYEERSYANRGLGYGAELAGSAVGAVVSSTLVLPVIGLTPLLWSLVGLLVLGLIGCLLTTRVRA
jgi:spermidine synthase